MKLTHFPSHMTDKDEMFNFSDWDSSTEYSGTLIASFRFKSASDQIKE